MYLLEDGGRRSSVTCGQLDCGYIVLLFILLPFNSKKFISANRIECQWEDINRPYRDGPKIHFNQFARFAEKRNKYTSNIDLRY